MHLAITGPTGLGKTYSAILWAYERFPEVFICRHLEDLKHYKGEKCIVFDDISFELIEPTQLIKLTDTDFHSSIRILNTIVRIEPDVFKIFTHNDKFAFQPILSSTGQQNAIVRRLTICQLHERKEVFPRLWEAYHKFIHRLELNKQLPLWEQVHQQ